MLSTLCTHGDEELLQKTRVDMSLAYPYFSQIVNSGFGVELDVSNSFGCSHGTLPDLLRFSSQTRSS